jgi:uncharacterized membrane protein YecN with MAPEG domain
MHLPITLTITAAAVFVHLWLAIRCSRVRISEKIMVGEGGSDLMRARMRAHSNFTENAPLFVILLGLTEATGGTSLWLWGAGIAFIAARIVHAFGMERPTPNVFRGGGILVNFVLLAGMAIYAIILSYGFIPRAV